MKKVLKLMHSAEELEIPDLCDFHAKFFMIVEQRWNFLDCSPPILFE